MVKSSTVPLFLLPILSLNCQLYLTTRKVLLLLSIAGHAWTFPHTNPPCSPFPSATQGCSSSWSIFHVPPASQAPGTLLPSRHGSPTRAVPTAPSCCSGCSAPIPRNSCAIGGCSVGSAAGGAPKPSTVNKSSNQAQSFASMKSHFLSSAKYCVKFLFSLKTLSLS